MFDLIVYATTFLQMWNFWQMGRGKIYYPTVFLAIVGIIFVDSQVALSHTNLTSILLFNVTNLWALVNCVKGWKQRGKWSK